MSTNGHKYLYVFKLFDLNFRMYLFTTKKTESTEMHGELFFLFERENT